MGVNIQKCQKTAEAPPPQKNQTNKQTKNKKIGVKTILSEEIFGIFFWKGKLLKIAWAAQITFPEGRGRGATMDRQLDGWIDIAAWDHEKSSLPRQGATSKRNLLWNNFFEII